MMQPPVLTLQVNANGFNLIRALLGKAPHDEVAPFIAELNAQVTQQITDYNAPKMPPSAAADPVPAAPPPPANATAATPSTVGDAETFPAAE